MADDVALNRALLTGYFEGTAHKLITATNGLEALEQAEKHRPDVILMDMRMPELDGHETTKRLKANAALKHIPVIAVTASSFREEEARARKICDGFIRKPFNRAELIAELKRFLKPQPRRQAQSRQPAPKTADARWPNAPGFGRGPGQAPELLAKLREEERTVWPAFARRKAMDEIEAVRAPPDRAGLRKGSGQPCARMRKAWISKCRSSIWIDCRRPRSDFLKLIRCIDRELSFLQNPPLRVLVVDDITKNLQVVGTMLRNAVTR